MKCLSRELDERYSSIQSLLFDLRRFRDLALVGGDLSQLVVGQADRSSRFSLPSKLVERDDQFKALSRAWEAVASPSGSGLGGEDIDDVLEYGIEEPEEQEPRMKPGLSSSTSASRPKTGGKAGVVTVWGVSGVGKSRLVELWAKELETREGGHAALIGWAKLDREYLWCSFFPD